MNKAKNVKIGDVIQFPWKQFSAYRKGWNGWTFRAAIVEKLYISKSGVECATVRYNVNANEEATMNIKREYLFDFDVEIEKQIARKALEEEKKGLKVCWSADAKLLVNHGII